MDRNDVIHPVYLPFTESQFEQHFVAADRDSVKNQMKYYLDQVDRYAQCQDQPGLDLRGQKVPCQIQKDERFWTATCLMSLFHSSDPVATLSSVLRRCFGDTPPSEGAPTWGDLLGGKRSLYFEAVMPSPKDYTKWLSKHVPDRQFIPYILNAAKRDTGELRHDLEGPTHLDALLLADTGFAVCFESKVLADISCGVTFDPMRNQIARVVDVMLETNPKMRAPFADRDPDHTLFVLLTPEMFRRNPHTRLYGWLMNDYREHPNALARDLGHRKGVDWASVSRRMGWLTWEDCDSVMPGACPWLKMGGLGQP